MKWEGLDSLRPLLIPVSKLSTHPENPRRGDVKRIAESLARFGQMRPIPYQASTGYILAGNHTFRAATEEMGWTHVAATAAEVDNTEALGYVLADNRTADLGEYHDAGLAAALTKMIDAGALAGTGYTMDEADDVLAGLNAIAETDPEEFGGGHSETEEALAARQAARAAAPIMREVVLMLDPESYVRFGGFVRILQKEYGTTGVIETVFRAVETEARRLNTGGE